MPAPQDFRELLRQKDERCMRLLENLRARLPELRVLLAAVEEHWGVEDAVYRFYHGSFKVYHAQAHTERIVEALRSLLPQHEMDPDFLAIVEAGTGKVFQAEHNQDWPRHTRPILEALFHAHYFLGMACKYGEQLGELPKVMPSGWAALLYLYRLR